MTQRIARMQHEELLANATEVIDTASKRLSELCHGAQWRMSVPVDDSDSDVPLGAVIRLASALRPSDDELIAIRRCIGWAATCSDNPSADEIDLARRAIARFGNPI